MAVEQITSNSPDGATMGQDATEKISFYGSSPVAQPASADQAAVAETASNPTAPAAMTSAQLAFTWTANDPGVTNGEATIDDGVTVGDDNDAGAALSAIEDQYNKLQADVVALRAEVITYETAISALVADSIVTNVLVNQLRSELVSLGIIKGAA